MQDDRPNRLPWPPMIYLTATVVGVILGYYRPLPWTQGSPSTVLQGLGAGLALAALLLDLTTVKTFRDHKTTIMPHKGATHLITSGPFAWSRNPIYVANTMLVLAAGFFFANTWLLILAPIAAVLTQKLAIEREEKHLARLFGAEWTTYAARVRRWL